MIQGRRTGGSRVVALGCAISGLTLLLATGCLRQNTSDTAPQLRLATNEEVLEAIRAFGGKPTVVNFWATWCPPCVEETPDLVRFHKEYVPERVRFISVSVDDPGDAEGKVRPFLDEMEVPYSVFLVREDQSAGELIKAIHEDWEGELPATFVYDGDGGLEEVWFGEVSFQVLVETVGPMLP